MKNGIKKYIEFELASLTREERRDLTQKLIDEIAVEKWSFDDVLFLLKEIEKKSVYIRQPLFEEILYPILRKEINNKNVEAIKILIKLEQNYYAYQRKLSADKFESSLQLIKIGLRIDENDKELLVSYEKELLYQLEFSIHEIPSGVLYGMDGASIDECNKLMETLKIYQQVCHKLSLENDEDRKDLIEECDFHYRNYKIYLENLDKYENYKKFLSIFPETS